MVLEVLSLHILDPYLYLTSLPVAYHNHFQIGGTRPCQSLQSLLLIIGDLM